MRPLALVLAATLMISGCCEKRTDRDQQSQQRVSSNGASGGSWNLGLTGNLSGGSGNGILLLFGVIIVVVLVVTVVDSCGC